MILNKLSRNHLFLFDFAGAGRRNEKELFRADDGKKQLDRLSTEIPTTTTATQFITHNS